jgi:hypothetical protein
LPPDVVIAPTALHLLDVTRSLSPSTGIQVASQDMWKTKVIFSLLLSFAWSTFRNKERLLESCVEIFWQVSSQLFSINFGSICFYQMPVFHGS